MEAESKSRVLETKNEELENKIATTDTKLNQKAQTLGENVASVLIGLFYTLIVASLLIGIASFIVPTISLTLQIISFIILTFLTIFGFSHKFSSDSIKKPVVNFIRQRFLKYLE